MYPFLLFPINNFGKYQNCQRSVENKYVSQVKMKNIQTQGGTKAKERGLRKEYNL